VIWEGKRKWEDENKTAWEERVIIADSLSYKRSAFLGDGIKEKEVSKERREGGEKDYKHDWQNLSAAQILVSRGRKFEWNLMKKKDHS